MYRPLDGVRISPGFPLVLILFALLGEEAVLEALLVAAALHELGHYAALRLCGVEVTALELTAFGARLSTVGRQALSYGRELVTLLAGPGMNLLCALLTAALTRRLNWSQGDLFTGAQIVLGAFNLLPILPLDGGRALCLALSFLLGPTAGERLTNRISLIALGALALGATWVVLRSGGDGWLLLGVAGVAGASLREMGLVNPTKWEYNKKLRYHVPRGTTKENL